jgi:hypothetical protein
VGVWSLKRWIGKEVKVTFVGGSLEHRTGELVFLDPSDSGEQPRWFVIKNIPTEAEVLIYTSGVACLELRPESNTAYAAANEPRAR